MTQYAQYTPNLSTSRVRHIASTTHDSYRKTTLLKNSNFLPIYTMLKKIAGPSVASFYLNCDNKEADQQKRYRNLLSKSLEIEDRFRKAQHDLTRYNNEEEINETLKLYQEEKEMSTYMQPSKDELNEKEIIRKELKFVIELENKNYLRAEKLKILSENIEKKRYSLFHSKFADLFHGNNCFNPYFTYQDYKINRKQKNYINDSNIRDLIKRDATNSFKNHYLYKEKSAIPKKQSLNKSSYNNHNEEPEISYQEKQKRIKELKFALSTIKKIKHENKIALVKRNEAAKSFNFLAEKRKKIFFNSFNSQDYQSFMETSRKSQILHSQKLFKTKIQQIQMNEKKLQIRKENLMKLLEEIEFKSKEVVEKEKYVIQLEQQILEIRKKYEEIVFQSQKELDFFDVFSSMRSSSFSPYDSQYKEEFQEILKRSYE